MTREKMMYAIQSLAGEIVEQMNYYLCSSHKKRTTKRLRRGPLNGVASKYGGQHHGPTGWLEIPRDWAMVLGYDRIVFKHIRASNEVIFMTYRGTAKTQSGQFRSDSFTPGPQRNLA